MIGDFKLDINTEKLKKFENICINMSNKEKEDLKNELDKKALDKINNQVEKFSNKLVSRLDKEKIKIEKEYNKKIVDIEFNSKKQILAEYERENNELYILCTQKLVDYTNTNDYTELLKKIFNISYDALDSKENLKIYLTSKDKNKIDLTSYGDVEELDEKYIGGIILKNDHMIVDNTFLTNLKEKINGIKENF